MVTIKDVALKSGFSITTVSKALNDYPDISDKTKKKILEFAIFNLKSKPLIFSWKIDF